MISRLFLKLTDYPAFRRLLRKPIYELLAKRFKVKDWSFMNYGYASLGNKHDLHLFPEDEINRYPTIIPLPRHQNEDIWYRCVGSRQWSGRWCCVH